MRATIAAAEGYPVRGRTNHFFLFSHVNGGWTIDTGRFFVYAFLIATAVLMAVILESQLHSRGARREGESS
jgi:hypothetical protein